jgi:ABC-type transport system involved in Fe-S cluster assembly fused permease/ATPase subunit
MQEQNMKFSNVLQNLLKENLQFDFTSFSTARLADRILVLENGTLLESGTHQDLLKADGRYAELLIYKQEVINNKMIIF